MPELTLLTFLTACFIVATIFIIRVRFTRTTDTNLPLYYYAAFVIYARGFEGAYDMQWVVVGIITSLFIRFEFMGGIILKVFRFIELVVFAYILLRAFDILFGGM